MTNLEIGKRIAKYRKLAGINQEEMGKRLGTTGDRVSNWERGITNIPAETCIKISEILKVNINDILPTKKSELEKINQFYNFLNRYDSFNVLKRFLNLKYEYQQIVNRFISILEEMQKEQKEDDEEILIAASGAENLTDEEREYNIELGKKYYELAHKDDK